MKVFWERIEEFPNYSVSNFGDVVNEVTEKLLRQSLTQGGTVKVNLVKDGIQYSRSVKRLVAEAFVEGRTSIYNSVINLDGNLKNNQADNLMWRPKWFTCMYTKQFENISNNYLSGPIVNVQTRDRYVDVYEAATMNGFLFKDIWRSINNLQNIAKFPTPKFSFIR